MELITANLSSKAKRAYLHGREYLVANATLINPGVLEGSQGRLLYPPDETPKNAEAWNHMPIVVYHPKDSSGNYISARTPAVINRQGIGYVFSSKADPKLAAELWFDVVNTKRLDDRYDLDLMDQLEKGKPVEVSTGLFTRNTKAEDGATYNGKSYDYVARDYRPDHLAILPDQVGACSVKDGCGVNVNQAPTDNAVGQQRDLMGRFGEGSMMSFEELEKAFGEKGPRIKRFFDLHKKSMSALFGQFTAQTVLSSLSGKRNPTTQDVAKALKKLGFIKNATRSPYAAGNRVQDQPRETQVTDSPAKIRMQQGPYSLPFIYKVNEGSPMPDPLDPDPVGNETSHEQLRTKLGDLLRGMYTQDQPSCYIHEVYDDYLIYDHGGEMYKIGYTMADDQPSLDGDPVEVVREVTYAEVENTELTQPQEGQDTGPVSNLGDTPMALTPERKAQIVSGLVANCNCTGPAPWKGKDSAALNALSDDTLSAYEDMRAQLAAVAPAPTTNSPTASTTPAPQVHGAGRKLTAQEWMDQMPDQIKPVWNSFQEVYERDLLRMIDALAANLGIQGEEALENWRKTMKDAERAVLQSGQKSVVNAMYQDLPKTPVHNQQEEGRPAVLSFLHQGAQGGPSPTLTDNVKPMRRVEWDYATNQLQTMEWDPASNKYKKVS